MDSEKLIVFGIITVVFILLLLGGCVNQYDFEIEADEWSGPAVELNFYYEGDIESVTATDNDIERALKTSVGDHTMFTINNKIDWFEEHLEKYTGLNNIDLIELEVEIGDDED